MKRFLPLIFCLFAITAFASKKHAPLPEAVYQAKTVFIVNKTGYQSTTDGAFDEISKWGKLTVVGDRANADIILTFTYSDALLNGTTQWGEFSMAAQLKGSEDIFFQTSTQSKGFHLASNRGAVGAGNCVKDFEKRLNEKN